MAAGSRYILYVDEAGDDGLKPFSSKAGQLSAEWFVVGGLLFRSEHDIEMVRSVRSLIQRLGLPPDRELHFVDLNDKKRLALCAEIASLMGRWFCVISHKENMRGFRNQLAQRVSNKNNPLYNFLIRILLERVSEYCAAHNRKLDLENSTTDLQVVLSERGGLSAPDVSSDLRLLWTQSKSGRTFLNKKKIDFSVFSPDNLSVRANSDLLGRQLADAIASAMLKALPSSGDRELRWDFLRMLLPRTARSNGRILNCGITVLPFEWRTKLPNEVGAFMDRLEREAAGARLHDPTGRE